MSSTVGIDGLGGKKLKQLRLVRTKIGEVVGRERAGRNAAQAVAVSIDGDTSLAKIDEQ